MKKSNLYTFIVLFLVCLLSQDILAQDVAVTPNPDKLTGKAVEARPSPMAVATMKKGDAYIKVTYGQPHLRDRKMLGGDAVPYGKVWRLGANEATEITLTKDMTIGGKKLKAGTYSMFAIPEAGKWTIIFNNEVGQWGAYNYDKSKDIARIDVPVKKAEKSFEAFTIWFSADGSAMNMAWGDTKVSVPVQVNA